MKNSNVSNTNTENTRAKIPEQKYQSKNTKVEIAKIRNTMFQEKQGEEWMATRIEGLWDCAYCGQKGIKARFDTCISCGRPRGVETCFYLPDDMEAAALTEEEKAKTTNEPDWLCPYCGAYNRSNTIKCNKCGAAKSDSKTNYGREQLKSQRK